MAQILQIEMTTRPKTTTYHNSILSPWCRLALMKDGILSNDKIIA